MPIMACADAPRPRWPPSDESPLILHTGNSLRVHAGWCQPPTLSLDPTLRPSVYGRIGTARAVPGFSATSGPLPGSVGKRCATSEDLSLRTPEPGPRAGTNSESGTNRQNGVGSEWQAGNIPEFLQQSFATRANASNGTAAARFPSIFAADFCNMRKPMFTGLSAMMQNLPFWGTVREIMNYPHGLYLSMPNNTCEHCGGSQLI